MKSKVRENIMEYMNSIGHKEYNYLQVSKISNSIKKEYHDRKIKGIKINGKSKEGKLKINERIADMVNNNIPSKYHVSPDDVRLYKKSFALEYQDRTGRCAWGFKDVRKRLGYDTETGLEL